MSPTVFILMFHRFWVLGDTAVINTTSSNSISTRPPSLSNGDASVKATVVHPKGHSGPPTGQTETTPPLWPCVNAAPFTRVLPSFAGMHHARLQTHVHATSRTPQLLHQRDCMAHPKRKKQKRYTRGLEVLFLFFLVLLPLNNVTCQSARSGALWGNHPLGEVGAHVVLRVEGKELRSCVRSGFGEAGARAGGRRAGEEGGVRAQSLSNHRPSTGEAHYCRTRPPPPPTCSSQVTTSEWKVSGKHLNRSGSFLENRLSSSLQLQSLCEYSWFIKVADFCRGVSICTDVTRSEWRLEHNMNKWFQVRPR